MYLPLPDLPLFMLQHLTVGLLLLALTGPSVAQPTVPSPTPDVISQGTSYFVFTEPGAPTIEVLLVTDGGRAGIFRLAEETTLTEFIALAGSAGPPSEETRQVIRTTTIRVLRLEGGLRRPVYEATPQQLIREPGQHPTLQDGDIVEIDTEVEEVDPPFTFLQGLDVAARVASLASLVILLIVRAN